MTEIKEIAELAGEYGAISKILAYVLGGVVSCLLAATIILFKKMEKKDEQNLLYHRENDRANLQTLNDHLAILIVIRDNDANSTSLIRETITTGIDHLGKRIEDLKSDIKDAKQIR